MTTNTPRTDTAPADKFFAWWTSIETDLRKSLILGARTDTEKLHDLLRTTYEAGQSSQPSPSTGGEPATDSAGQPAKKMGLVALTDHLMALADVQDCDITLHFANGGQLQVKKSPNRPLAAREPAPVARELDVEAERRKFEAVMPEEYPRDRNMPDKSYNSPFLHVAWQGWLARATAESAPASAAPDEQQIGRGPRYTCIGKGGDYELIGEARGAGSMKLYGNMAVYRDVTSGALYYRATHDFNSRMTPSNSSPADTQEPK
ncbi:MULTISPECIES: hypothetical protein [unclassified Massilia]|uniref:hypothetical protein n=1 Tax=unclassified Massilia TaxID=2609279 RepID=UPI00177D827A|nr:MULTISPECIES: hypothetical protein [unclassified Massilia]MBD8531511.1 hypothetical protein [Massilia sp. CFBP 13647]MBD8673693.1 hypothetical protein [Massilia sp. CFBP 13721]